MFEMKECPEHEGAFDCSPFCDLCHGAQEIPNIHANPEILTNALLENAPANLGVKLSYEFPGFWAMTTNETEAEFSLGDANGFFGWNDDLSNGDETTAKTPKEMALAFWAWYGKNYAL